MMREMKTMSMDDISLLTPVSLASGFYFTKLLISNEPVFLTTATMQVKQNVQSNGTKQYMDFVVQDPEFIEWIEKLEEEVQLKIYDHRDEWFVEETIIELDDIETVFIPTLKMKSGKYILRGYMPLKKTQFPSESHVMVYDTDEIPVPLEDLKENTKVVAVLYVSGIQFNNKCFQLVVNIKQMMVLNTTPFTKCLIKSPQVTKLETIDLA